MFSGANLTLPVVADAGEHTQHLVQVGSHGVPPSFGELRVAVRLLHPGGGWGVVVQRGQVAFHRGELQLKLPHEGAELPHEELQPRGLLGAGAAVTTSTTATATATYPQFELRPQRRVEETLPPSGAHGRGPELVSVGQKGEDVDDELAG